jgi:hypothetical protein
VSQVVFYSLGLSEAFGPEPCELSGIEAWALLAEGAVVRAHDTFDCLARITPDDALPKIGLAIAAGLHDEHGEAVHTMRDALRQDPVSLLDVPAGSRLDEQLHALAEHYDEQARRQYGNVDALFMVATLRYLLGDDSAAHYAIDVGINLGDNDESAHILQSLIEASPPDRTLRRAQ